MKRLEINRYIIADAEICHGRPTFTGTRIMVWQVLDMLEAGASIKEILEAFPTLTKAHIQAAFSYAARLVKDETYASLGV